MSGLKTFAHRALLGLAFFNATLSNAQPLDTEQQLQTFATCAGRLSAVMEHQWMFNGTASEHTKMRRDAVVDLVKAIMPPDQGREVLQWRISAKLAQSALLTRATFNDDAADAAWASRQAERLERECAGLLLS